MKLSEAIRIGAKQSKPLRGELVKTNGQVKACALGCAGLGAIPGFEINPSYSRLLAEFSALMALVEFEGRTKDLENWIVVLNDERGMTRKQIADWVEAQGY